VPQGALGVVVGRRQVRSLTKATTASQSFRISRASAPFRKLPILSRQRVECDALDLLEQLAPAQTITSQVPIDRWPDRIGVHTLADAILDRVIRNAYRIELAGESLRKRPPSS
jgi:IstB-like ATP binding protein